MLERQFDASLLYNRIVHYYVDKKGLTKERANAIAQAVVLRESQRRICKGGDCGHFSHDHLRNSGACLVQGCGCGGFSR